jgi:CheY-like chemotaxis protein
MPIGHIVWDLDFRVVTWNPAAERIFGFTAAEALGKIPYDFIVSAEVSIRLPASVQAVEAVKDVQKTVNLGSGRVLVMDDERPVRKIAQSMLESLGYTVECASNGDEAIECYRERLEEGSPFDAVIMDLTVPGGKGGKESVKELLTIDPTVRAIVSSGYATDAVLADFRDYGFCAILGKPYRLQELSDVLENVLGV